MSQPQPPVSADESPPPPADPDEAEAASSRIHRIFGGSKALIRVVYRDPEHVPERLTWYAVDHLAKESRDWAASTRAANPETPRAKIADDLRTRSAQIARIDGAISGTPFFIALVPGYLTYLIQEMRMTMRTAALYDRDPGILRTAAEMLALRGVHPNVESAEAALVSVRGTPIPEKPPERRPLRHWIHSVFLLLVFGGFMSPSSGESREGARGWIRAAFGLVVGVGLWVITWVFPVTFMIAMAWGCESHTRQLGRRTLVFYAGEEERVDAAIRAADMHEDHGHDKREILRAAALFLSVAVPIAFIAYVDHVRNTTGVNWLGAVGAVIALSLVMATIVLSKRS